ncbi:MAG: nucleotide exchange factor GrpE [Planctomycetota bacterium]
MDDVKSKEQPDQDDREPRVTAEAEDEAQGVTEPPDELETLRCEVEDLREQKLRLLAEQRNQQQRAARELAEAVKYAEADFARELLVVLDDLVRTRESVQAGSDATAIADGVRIVYEHFLKVLKGRHIEPIEALGQPFDPGLHEAMLQQPSAEHPAGTVIEEHASGYRMHERVLRHSRVIVSGNPTAPDQAERDETDEATDEE